MRVTNDNKSFSKFINSDIAKKLFGNGERKFIHTNYIKNLLKILMFSMEALATARRWSGSE